MADFVAKNTTVQGNKIMLFYNKKSLAFGTSHSLTISTETSSVATKDSGIWDASKVNKVSWSISSEHLFPIVATGATSGSSEFTDLLEAMTSRKEIEVYFGLKDETGVYSASTKGDGLVQGDSIIAADNWIPAKGTNDFMLYGKVVITNLTMNANNGEECSYSVEMTGLGSITKKQFTA